MKRLKGIPANIVPLVIGLCETKAREANEELKQLGGRGDMIACVNSGECCDACLTFAQRLARA